MPKLDAKIYSMKVRELQELIGILRDSKEVHLSLITKEQQLIKDIDEEIAALKRVIAVS